MGHGDRIALVDANYSGTRGRRVIYLPGLDTPRVLWRCMSVLPIEAALTGRVRFLEPMSRWI
jgi:L-fucose mutarotase/ribose pyranase (RbsD/FucU family)